MACTSLKNDGVRWRRSVLEAAWTEGAKEYMELTRDTRKRLFVQDFAHSQPHHVLKLLLDHTKSLHKGQLLERGSLRGKIEHIIQKIEHILQAINRHAGIGDVLVQNSGQPATFAWGSIRCVLLLATADLEATQVLASCFIDVAEELQTAEDQLLLFPTDHDLFESAKHLFASVIRFLVKTTFFLRDSKPKRALKAASGGSEKSRQLFDDVQRRTNSMDRIFSTATEKRSRKIEQSNRLLESLHVDKQSNIEPLEAEVGTCHWLLAASEYQSWIASQHEGLLWVEGASGCGKSVLANHLYRTADTEVTAFHSCHSSSTSLDFAVSILAVFVRIVISSSKPALWHDVVFAELQNLIEPANPYSAPDLSVLQTVLDRILAKKETPETLIVVDALSECRGPDAAALFEHIEHLSKTPKVRLIVFSRHDTRFERKRVVQMVGCRVESDIKLYVDARISRTESLRSLHPAEIRQIAYTCSGMFLMTKFLLDDLEHADSADHQMEILKTTPTKLVDRYDKDWRRADNDLSRTNRMTRWEVLALVLAARRPLTVDEISSFISIDTCTNKIHNGRKLLQPLLVVERVCRPFVSFMERTVEITHPSMKDYLQQKLEKDSGSLYRDSHAHLADKCLSILSEETYTEVSFAAGLLRKHLLPPGLNSGFDTPRDDEPVSYEYAALNWQDHVVALRKPSDSLLAKVAEFITSIAAVTYSERLLDIKGGNEASSLNAQIDVRVTLTTWLQSLPSSSQGKICIKDFFVVAHNKVRRLLTEDDQDDHLLPYTPAIRLGQWYSMGGTSYSDFRQAYEYKKLAVDGSTKVLGKRNPLTLKWRISWVNEFFAQGLIREAELELKDIVEISKVVLRNSEEYFKAVQLLGDTQYHLTKFEEAFESLEESGLGLLQLLGNQQWIYQVNNLYQAWVLERQGDLDKARQLLESVIETWGPIGGATNGLTLFAYTSLGSVRRKQQDYSHARDNLQFAWDNRRLLFSLNSNTTVDAGLQLSLTLREMDLPEETLKLLDAVEKSEVFPKDFKRVCQATYFRALVAFDQGEFEHPMNDLMKLVDETIGNKRENNNRDCLWIRTTLADALRSRVDDPEDGTKSEALMLFSELVKHRDDGSASQHSIPTLKDEPESRAQLVIAEKAIRMVKDRDRVGAEELLRNNELEWVRQKDFWIGQGGPPTDTAYMKSVTFLSPKKQRF